MKTLTRLNDLIAEGKRVRGRWILAKNNRIAYEIDGQDEVIVLEGALLSAGPGQLVISATEKQRNQNIIASLYRLSGHWRVDEFNRLVFEVERARGAKDVLTFTGSWKVGENNELIYTYRQTRLKTKTNRSRSLVFKGLWDVNEKQRLTYTLEGDAESAFRFRGSWQTKSILAKQGQIRYQLGVEVSGKSKVPELVIFGKWKLSRDLALFFDTHYGPGRKRSMVFGGEYRINKQHQIELSLTTAKGKPLGVDLVLTRDFLISEGQAFLRIRKSFEEARIETGVRVKW